MKADFHLTCKICPEILCQKEKRYMPLKIRHIAFKIVVPVVGVEPTRPCELRILSPVRLPFRHTGSSQPSFFSTCYTQVLRRALGCSSPQKHARCFRGAPFMQWGCAYWRYHPDLNWGIKVLQTFALPLGDGTIVDYLNIA